MLVNDFICWQESRLHFVRAGTGKKVLLFFHGFGQDHTVYLPVIQHLTPDYRLYIFDLYFHGQSSWNRNEQPLRKEHWKEIMETFLANEQIQRFSLVGYSLGGKFALATVEAFAHQIDSVFLIAADGIETSFWYSMATYPSILRRFFRGMIGNYNRFSALARWLHRYNLVDKGLIRFADFQMSTEEKRKRVYYSWVVFRKLSFSMRLIGRILRENNIRTIVIVGKYDKVIEPENMQVLLQYVPKAEFHVLEAGHSGLIYTSLPLIRNAGNSPG